jgi:hypothetical protein
MEHDMAICLVFFNPADSFRLVMNLLYTINRFKRDNLPVFVLELVYEGKKPQIPDAIHVYAKSYMFHKENLCRVLEKYVPEQYTKLAFFDGDLIYKNSEWYTKTSKLLDEFDVVQPFESAYWLDLTYKISLKRAKSTCLAPDIYTRNTNEYHPGFAWCFRREWYNKAGFYDKKIFGGGDGLSSDKFMRRKFSESGLSQLKSVYGESCLKFYNSDDPKTTYVKDIDILHLFHGKLKNRKHNSRYREIFYDVKDCIDDLTYTNEYGVYEWKDIEKFNPRFLKYFKDRFDDGLSCECSNE